MFLEVSKSHEGLFEPLSPRESASRALAIITFSAGSDDIDPAEYDQMLAEIAGSSVEETYSVLVAMASIAYAGMEAMSPLDPLAAVRALGTNLDLLED